MNENQKQIITHVMVGNNNPEAILTEDVIKKDANFYAIRYPVTSDQMDELITSLHSKLAIRMDRGAFVKEHNHVAWYNAAKIDMQTDFWDRYSKHLYKDAGFPPKVVNAIDVSTDEMMDLLGNPMSEFDFQRRGLVIGDVQSGKTATYTALINKAADAGYRVVILLTGTIEKLRKQTQGRLDEGFVGLDSTALIRDKNNIYVGVGNIDSSFTGWALTSTTSDFNKATAEKLNGQLSSITRPVLFVLKKNKSVLEKLEQWLRVYNTNPNSNKCPLPLLLVDDEADNASVNTKTEEDPTAINSNIRKLLNLFNKASYVGFTATPFANIFIDPDSNEEMLKNDLFPRDFIYALEAPSNYISARSLFSEDGENAFMLKSNDDCEDFLPEKHKKDFMPLELPLSLKQAIASFFICNAVRDLRGDTKKHRSMLINVSRFIAVQEQIKKAIDAYVRDLQRDIKNYYLIGPEALDYDSFKFIKSVYDKEFSNIPDFEFGWEEIQTSLHMAVASIVVRTVNGGNASKNLNYDEYTDDGLRLIAIGGFSLSRGLTLEGLCVSYFYRNSKMYDTLMQMGRWFGYREGYADICQVWMGEGAIEWYRYISDATDSLRAEVRRMREQNKTPIDFGLSVRSDISALLITARNKMKTASDYERAISLNGKVVETRYMHLDRDILEQNLKTTKQWINSLANDGFEFKVSNDMGLKQPQVKDVPKKYILEFLGEYKSHYLNMDFQTENLVELIKTYTDGTVDKWDIVIASGMGSEADFCGLNLHYIKRNFGVRKDKKAIQMSDTKSRLGSANFAKAGLTQDEVVKIEAPFRKEMEENGKKHSFSEDTYFTSGIKRNPLMVIYPVELSPEVKDQEIAPNLLQEKKAVADSLPVPIIGLSVGIPRIDGRENKTFKYKINVIKFKELFGVDDDDFEERDETIDQEVGLLNV